MKAHGSRLLSAAILLFLCLFFSPLVASADEPSDGPVKSETTEKEILNHKEEILQELEKIVEKNRAETNREDSEDSVEVLKEMVFPNSGMEILGSGLKKKMILS